MKEKAARALKTVYKTANWIGTKSGWGGKSAENINIL